MNGSFQNLFAQFLQFASHLAIQAWAYLQPIYAQAPTSLLLGIAIGVVAAQMLRGALVVALVGTLMCFAFHVLGLSI